MKVEYLSRSMLLILLLLDYDLFAQDELKQAVEEATKHITNARSGAIRLGKAASAIVGIVGAMAVYSKWSNGESDVRKASASWLGGLLFVAIAFVILESI